MRIDHVRPYVLEGLHAALNPRRIAVVGASRHPGKLGYEIVRSLLERGFKGEVLPVNPRTDEVQGRRAYKRLGDIEGEVDLAFIAVPSYIVRSVIEDCAASGVKLAAIAASGFKELGNGCLQDEITQVCRSRKLPLLGPNLLALGNPHYPFSCGLTPYEPLPGAVAVISQSGANLLAALGWSSTQALGISFFAGLGNKADIDFSEFIAYAGKDWSNTRAVALYIEGMDSEEAFLESCESVIPHTPVVALKAGASVIGRRAAMAHTASEPAAEDRHYDEVFERAGVVRVKTLQDLLDSSLALALMPPTAGCNVGIVTNGGGSGLLAADEFERRGMGLQPLSETSADLDRRVAVCTPPFGSHLNPIDLGASASPGQFENVVLRLLKDRRIDGVLVSICPTSLTRISGIVKTLAGMAHLFSDLYKPLIVQLQGGADCDAAIHHLRMNRIPAYPTPERAVAAFAALRRYGAFRAREPVSAASALVSSGGFN
ncbi:MAG TPA: CoA-binding protein [Bryobacteraceae bacterium]|nr:CoA-binding protein [Bryobacteraceae bacterium]